MTIHLDQIDQAFASGMHQADWRSPAKDNEFHTESHYIIVEDKFAFRACRTVSDSESFDIQKDADFKAYPPCKTCQKQITRFKKSPH